MYVIIYTDAYLYMHFYTYKYWHKYVNMVMGQYQCENLCPINTFAAFRCDTVQDLDEANSQRQVLLGWAFPCCRSLVEAKFYHFRPWLRTGFTMVKTHSTINIWLDLRTCFVYG